MGANTSIEWADDTANFWEGCTQISPGCDNCYAMTLAARFGSVEWNGPPRKVKAGLAVVRKAQRLALASGKPRFVFVNSISDFFDNQADPVWRLEALDAMRAAPNCIFLVLTKRIGNVDRMMQETGIDWGRHLQHVWLGASVVNQPEADRDIPKLIVARAMMKIPRVFLSVEPMLGPVNLDSTLGGTRWIGEQRGCAGDPRRRGAVHHGVGTPECPRELHHHHDEHCRDGIDWVICGGESGANARPMHPDWARSLRDQCADAGVPFFLKQWGEWAAYTPKAGGDLGGDMRAGRVRFVQGDSREPDGHFRKGDATMARVGKARAGRLLDGVEHNARPLHESTGRKGEALATRLTSPGSPA